VIDPPVPASAVRADSVARAIPRRAVHLCIDLQNLLGPQGPWSAEWAQRVLPTVVSLVEHAPARCIFTRFVPPESPEKMPGAWRAFYGKWPGLTGREVAPELLELMSPLKLFIPPARVLDKTRYSAFSNAALQAWLREMEAEAVIVSGAESDVCVLATVLSAVDLGYPTIVATDAICSGSDPCHEAALQLYDQRFSQQVQTMETAEIREAWTPA
jgi:nicotinamidase-related amidase